MKITEAQITSTEPKRPDRMCILFISNLKQDFVFKKKNYLKQQSIKYDLL